MEPCQSYKLGIPEPCHSSVHVRRCSITKTNHFAFYAIDDECSRSVGWDFLCCCLTSFDPKFPRIHSQSEPMKRVFMYETASGDVTSVAIVEVFSWIVVFCNAGRYTFKLLRYLFVALSYTFLVLVLHSFLQRLQVKTNLDKQKGVDALYRQVHSGLELRKLPCCDVLH